MATINNQNDLSKLLAANLNLLVYFLVLMEEQHVTRAAERVQITQPAMSLALKELRDMFRDPLLVKGGKGLIPTQRAKDVHEEIKKGFSHVCAAISHQAFDPKEFQYRFKVMMTDYAGALLLPKLMQKWEKEAPKISLEVLPMQLDSGFELAEEVDLSVGFVFDPLPSGFHETILFEEYYVCMMSSTHPRIKTRMDLDMFLAEKHMVVREASGAIGVVNAALNLLGKGRFIALEVPNFLLFPFIVANSELLITTTSRNAQLFREKLPIRTLPVPLSLPIVPVKSFWHDCVHNSKPHQWLRQQLFEVAQEVA